MFKLTWQNYCVTTELDKQTKASQKAVFQHVICTTGLKLCSSLVFDTLEDDSDIALIIAKLENVIMGRQHNL